MLRQTICVIGAAFAMAGAAWAEPTTITVRALADDAKFIGTSMGGVQITLRDAKTGKVLAKGLTEGATGDTAHITRAPRARGVALSAADTAAFRATIELAVPTLVKAEAYGPVGKPASAVTVSAERWIVPGQELGGDGWVLAFPGLVAEPAWTLGADGALNVTAKVTLMCGCPLQPGGDWNADDYRVNALLRAGKKEVAKANLAYAGQPSTFQTSMGQIAPGKYTLQLVASNAKTGNVGVVEREVVVPRAK